MFIDLLCNNFISNIRDTPNTICLANLQVKHTLTEHVNTKYIAAWLFFVGMIFQRISESIHQCPICERADMMGSNVSLVVGGVDVVPGITSDLNPVLKV